MGSPGKKIVSLDWYDDQRKKEHKENATLTSKQVKKPKPVKNTPPDPNSKNSQRKRAYQDQDSPITRKQMARAYRDMKRAEWLRSNPGTPKKTYRLGKSPGSYS